MNVKIGNSYVSQAAANFAKNSADDDDKNILKNLQEKFPNLKISVGTAPFSGSGTNNLSISPKILKEMQNNPDKKVEYEALIYDISQQNISQPGLKSHGFIIEDDGGLRGWGISENFKTNSQLDKKNKKSWLESLLPKKNPAAKVEISKKFANKNELMKHLQKNYSIVKNGAAKISGKYLQKCLTDEAEQKKLFENLEVASARFDNLEKNETLQIKIDENGEITMEGSKTTIGFNESKFARMLAAAKTQGDVKKILNLLQKDLEEVKAGLEKNYCDESEVEKVEKMIERAKEIFNKVEKNSAESLSSVDILI